MIGFLPQSTTRRPIYSVTGQKLCYLEAGPDGEWIYTLDGKKVAKLTRRHKAWIAKLEPCQSMTGGTVLTPEERFEW